MAILPIVSATAAELIVIYDSGHAKPLAPLLGPVQSARKDNPPRTADGTALGAADIEAVLPISSPGLTPGVVTGRTHTQPFTRPFFLVGSDARSRRWLHEHQALLADLGAVGMLVEAQSVEDIQAMRALARGLPLLPAAGTDIARALGVDHYPVAVADGRIWQ
ncbi:MAG: integrating conjugative element protein [Woeseiaceae bacterium]|nr:integrating conjugative element protein [Woeseiaceae bacterium]